MVNPFHPHCSYAEAMPGRRTFSAYVPDSCQAAYFPGDEPYDRCCHTGKRCTDEAGDEPHECSVLEQIGICPICMEEQEIQMPAYRNGRGILCCKKGHKFSEAEWAA